MILDIRDFHRKIVTPNLDDFRSDSGDLRKAFNASWAIDSFASHVYYHLLDEEKTGEKSEGDFKKFLAHHCVQFGRVQDVSNAAKHARLSRGRPAINSSTDLVATPVDGWLAYFLNVDRWGDQVLLKLVSRLSIVLLPELNESEKLLLSMI